MYALETKENVDRIFKKLTRRNPDQLRVIGGRIEGILEEPYGFKPMHFPLAGIRRVHFRNLVLLYSIGEQRKTVVLEDYEHHDGVYRKYASCWSVSHALNTINCVRIPPPAH